MPERCGRRLAGLWLGVMLLFASPVWALQNQLKDNPSPYLAMHGDDPVAWQQWGPGILALAKKQGKMIFISSGYFSCHWCHVMQRESYSNPRIAALLNKYFIPVKVDRELNPALDAYLVDYVERTRGSAGWPLNVFLTPEGYPLAGITYLPPNLFENVLRRLGEDWSRQGDTLRDLARRALLELTAESPESTQKPPPLTELRGRFLRQALALGDSLAGGFGEQGKFPMTPQLQALLSLPSDHPGGDLDHLLTLTLDQMARQGLRDHLGGGFFRYTVDPAWRTPHFEKMLYTQALLARVYLLAGRRYHRQDYLDLARETLDFVLREMRGAHGLFVASFSAVDAKGREGGHYLWTGEQLERVLGKQDAELARRHWGMRGEPGHEGGYLPRRGEDAAALAKALGRPRAEIEQRLRGIRERLLKARAQRPLPTDTKELAGWNGLLLGTLALAGEVLHEPDYTRAARRLATQIRARLWHEHGLWRARAADRPIGEADLSDYAYLADGLGLLLSSVQVPELKAWRGQLLEAAWKKFHGVRGWRLSETPPLPGMGMARAIQDGALPAAPALLIQASLELPELAPRARKALQAALPTVASEPFWYASYLVIRFQTHDHDLQGGDGKP